MLVVLVGLEVEAVGEGMAAARVTLSRRSWRTALRCLRWSLSRRLTLDELRNWVRARVGGEEDRVGRRMARRREVGTGLQVEERADMVVYIDGILGKGRTSEQVCESWLALKSVRALVIACTREIARVYNLTYDLASPFGEPQSRTDHTLLLRTATFRSQQFGELRCFLAVSRSACQDSSLKPL